MTNKKCRRLFMAAALAGTLLLSNCGKKDAATTEDGQPNTGEQAENATVVVPTWIMIDNPVDPALNYCDHLLMTGNHPRALYLLENLGQQYPDMTMPESVNQKLELLRAIDKKDRELTPSIGGLKANNATLQGQLEAAGKNGMIVLRRHLRDNKDPELSVAIARYAVTVDDAETGVAIYTLLKKKSCKVDLAKALATSLAKLIKKHSGTPPYNVQFLEGLLMNVVTESSPDKAMILRNVLESWNMKALPAGTLDRFAREIADDRCYDKIHLMEAMTALFAVHAKGNESTFNGYFSRPCYKTCSFYLSRATNDTRNCIKTMAKVLGPKFGLPDLEALKTEMALHYNLNEPTNTIYVRDSRSRLIGTKLSGKIAAHAIVKGLDGNCLQLNGNAMLRMSKKSPLKHMKENRNGKMKKVSRELNALMNGEYAFAIWVKPEKLPTPAECKKGVFSLICREMNAVGLSLHRDGTFSMLHPVATKPCIVKSAAKVPLHRWTHLAAVVSRKYGTVEIFMNGQSVGTGKFQADSSVENTYIRSSHFLIGAPSDQIMFGPRKMVDGKPVATTLPRYLDNAFIGKVDEIRLYFRTLSKKEVKQIYNIHAGLAN